MHLKVGVTVDADGLGDSQTEPRHITHMKELGFINQVTLNYPSKKPTNFFNKFKLIMFCSMFEIF